MTVVAVELALMVTSLVTKSRQDKVRSIIRIALFIALSVLVVTSVVQWGLRWYGFAALLLVWAAIGMWTLFQRHEATKEYRAKDAVVRAIGALLWVFLAMIPALVFPPYQLPGVTGPYTVAEVQYTYMDNSRIEIYADTGEMRKINVTFWAPENAEGAFPLVIFSHGSFGTKTSNTFLYHELASHGYVVASLDHPYHSFSTKDADEQITFVSLDYLRELQQEDAKTDKQQSHACYQKWMGIRMGDINFLLNTILAEAAAGAPGVYSLVDSEKIGVMGHSLGGSAALGIGRQRDDIDAVIALEAPFLFDIEGVENGEFVFNHDVYPVPVLNIYSDSSWEHLSEWAQYAENHALLSDTPATASNLHISGMGHLALTDLSLASPLLVRMFDSVKPTRDSVEGLKIINEASLEFFDLYLKN